jgi:hypothetical protein
MERNPFLVQLDNDNDEAGVRARLASHHGYQESYKPLVIEWLRERDEARASAASAIRDAREIETLSIAKEANDIARSASRWAMWASIIAVIAIVSEIKDQISALIP